MNNQNELTVLLSEDVNTLGERWGQIAATQTLITNPSLIDAIYHLYWDKEHHKRKHGAGGESPRRLTTVLKQFARTYDFVAMDGQQIVEFLQSLIDSKSYSYYAIAFSFLFSTAESAVTIVSLICLATASITLVQTELPNCL